MSSMWIFTRMAWKRMHLNAIFLLIWTSSPSLKRALHDWKASVIHLCRGRSPVLGGRVRLCARSVLLQVRTARLPSDWTLRPSPGTPDQTEDSPAGPSWRSLTTRVTLLTKINIYAYELFIIRLENTVDLLGKYCLGKNLFINCVNLKDKKINKYILCIKTRLFRFSPEMLKPQPKVGP